MKDAGGGERAEKAVEHPGIRAGLGRELVARARTVLQQVSDPQCRGDVDRLRHLVPVDQTPQLHGRQA